jgi:putative spermidine/putrescine transport system permease protein
MTRVAASAGHLAGHLYATAMVVFLASPLLVVVVLSFSASDYIAFPPDGYSLRWYRAILATPEIVDAFFLSVELAATATAAALLVSMPLSLVLVRGRLPGTASVRALALSPLVLPEVLLGLALLQFTAMRLHRDPSLPLLFAAHTVIVLPFAVQLLSSALARLNRDTEDAAATLGASPWRVFWHVVAPGIASGLAAAALLCFIFSFDNVAISLFLSSPGNVTLPVRLYEQATYASDPSLAAVSAVLVAIGLATIGVLARIRGLETAADSTVK